MALFNPSREQVRQFFFDAWSKFDQGTTLTGLEKLAIEVIHMHPEYHTVLKEPDKYLEQSYFPEMGQTNPFLHMSLHLSILEQLSVNQPPGIVLFYTQLKHKHQDEHSAQHDLMDCLAETLWKAQRESNTPDAESYLSCMQSKVHL